MPSAPSFALDGRRLTRGGMVGNSQVMSQSITDRMSHVMQINELMSDSIEISYHFDELSNVIDSAMHGTS